MKSYIDEKNDPLAHLPDSTETPDPVPESERAPTVEYQNHSERKLGSALSAATLPNGGASTTPPTAPRAGGRTAWRRCSWPGKRCGAAKSVGASRKPGSRWHTRRIARKADPESNQNACPKKNLRLARRYRLSRIPRPLRRGLARSDTVRWPGTTTIHRPA